MKLHTLKPAEGSIKNRKRIGRGQGSGAAGTAGRGHKGAKSRSGYSSKQGFEGGQMPLQRRVPKFGFNNFNRVSYKAINLSDLQILQEKYSVDTIDLDLLKSKGLVAKNDLVKILGNGTLKAKLNVTANAFSKTALEAIEKAGGTASKI
ncbi:50S ribosomal protein L15 [Marivirga harenae]|jgi:large subunit ribosomal protein L15|uniref:50S ribosomal protein L15 n=1 Tax=Marivirga TaxID=869806 RepID=UPI0026DEBCB3|nr:50S ribosomal protein L15 [Marivirga harenae]WKV14009.1 50S ribosomal protein L15 [Marivirga harenae]|tara:strand:+ start:322544 stop:322990 length:447 start_codon:yes stop_codon:yes gene_type:complete